MTATGNHATSDTTGDPTGDTLLLTITVRQHPAGTRYLTANRPGAGTAPVVLRGSDDDMATMAGALVADVLTRPTASRPRRLAEV